MSVKREDRGVLTRGLLIAIVTILILSVLPLPAGGVQSPVNQFTVIVQGQDKEFNVGDEAKLMIHFFDKDTPVDADDINVTIGYPQYGMGRYVEVDEASAKKGTGVYEIKVTLQERDHMTGTVTCFKDTTRGEQMNATAFFIILQPSPESYDVKVSADKPRLAPGETVRFTVTMTNDSKKVDPDNITHIYMNINDQYVGINGSELVKDGVGMYHYDYTVLDEIKNQRILFNVDTKYQDDWDGDQIYVVVDHYQVWLNTGSHTRTKFKGKLGICDMNGSAVAADVYMTYNYWTKDGEEKTGEFTGSTDAKGLLSLDIDAPNNRNGNLNLEIWVNGTASRGAEAYQQFIEHYASFDDEPTPHDDAPLEAFSNTEVLKADSVESAEFTLYSRGQLLANKEVFYYIYDGANYMLNRGDGSMGQVRGAGKATTDASGKLTLELNTPGAGTALAVRFKTTIPDGRNGGENWYREDTGFFVGAFLDLNEGVSVKLENFGIGKGATISLSKSGVSAGRFDMSVHPIDPDIKDTAELMKRADDILSWEMINEDFGAEESTLFSGGKASGKLGVPAFFPEDMNFAVGGSIWKEDASKPMGGETFMNFIIVDKDGNIISGDDDDDDGGFLPGFGPGLLVCGALAAAAVFTVRRKRKC